MPLAVVTFITKKERKGEIKQHIELQYNIHLSTQIEYLGDPIWDMANANDR